VGQGGLCGAAAFKRKEPSAHNPSTALLEARRRPRLCPPLALLLSPTRDPSTTRGAQAGCPPPEVESWASSFPVFPLLSAGVMGNQVYKEHFI